jgi:5-oxoprolinase (ATP-hydrolysing)
MDGEGKFQFAIDRGGTFTDVYARCPGGKIRVMKLLSVDPENYPDAPREGIRRILEEVCELCHVICFFLGMLRM